MALKQDKNPSNCMRRSRLMSWKRSDDTNLPSVYRRNVAMRLEIVTISENVLRHDEDHVNEKQYSFGLGGAAHLQAAKNEP